MKPLNTTSRGRSVSFYPYLGQRQWRAEGLECVCPCMVPLSPTCIESTSHPACCCVSDGKHLQQKGCSTGLKRTFSLGCVFLCLGPWISVLPDADHPDPAGPSSAPASMGVDHRQNGPPVLNTAPANLPPKVCLTAHQQGLSLYYLTE